MLKISADRRENISHLKYLGALHSLLNKLSQEQIK
jgi:hypothetical protein